MPTQAEIENRYYSTYAQSVTDYGLDPSVAYPHAVLDAYLFAYTGRGAPRITSGYRSIEKQRALYQQWEGGNRTGLTAKPARYSWHTLGRAVDVNSWDSNYEIYRDWWAYWYGNSVRIGENFGDRGHFDVPGPVYPSAAY